MKFLAIIVLSISLLASSSFAISLTPPQIYAVKENKPITPSEDPKDLTSLYIYIARFFSVYITAGGVFVTTWVLAASNNEDMRHKYDKISIAAGIGMIVLGGFGIYWSF